MVTPAFFHQNARNWATNTGDPKMYSTLIHTSDSPLLGTFTEWPGEGRSSTESYFHDDIKVPQL